MALRRENPGLQGSALGNSVQRGRKVAERRYLGLNAVRRETVSSIVRLMASVYKRLEQQALRDFYVPFYP